MERGWQQRRAMPDYAGTIHRPRDGWRRREEAAVCGKFVGMEGGKRLGPGVQCGRQMHRSTSLDCPGTIDRHRNAWRRRRAEGSWSCERPGLWQHHVCGRFVGEKGLEPREERGWQMD